MENDLALSPLGFTELESRLYCELLRDAPSSGYRLAQAIGKAPANVYSGLKTLAAKGAIVAQGGGGETVSYVPIPPAELLAGLKQGFEVRHEEARKALEALHKPPVEETVYQLTTVSQVVERCRSMIRGAKEILLFDSSPEFYDVLSTDLEAARARGAIVAGIVYSHDQATPTQPCVRPGALEGVEAWKAHWLTLVVDGEQQLLAQISLDWKRLFNGMWSDSAFLSCAYHDALACEVRLVESGVEGDNAQDSLKHISLMRFRPPGWRTMEAWLEAENQDGVR